MNMKFVTLLITITLLAGCASSKKIQVVQTGDNKLNCEQIAQQMAELDSIKLENDENKGMTGTNVAAALFFWPALAYTYMDAKDAEKLISDRKSHLTTLANEKGCSS